MKTELKVRNQLYILIVNYSISLYQLLCFGSFSEDRFGIGTKLGGGVAAYSTKHSNVRKRKSRTFYFIKTCLPFIADLMLQIRIGRDPEFSSTYGRM